MSESINALRRALDAYDIAADPNTLAVVLDAAKTVVTEAGSTPCRYTRKRLYATEELAVADSVNIATRKGVDYKPLYPHPCPDGDHWHLTSAEQALGYCENCEQWVTCWRTKTSKANVDTWILAAHSVSLTNALRCDGEGQYAAAIMMPPNV